MPSPGACGLEQKRRDRRREHIAGGSHGNEPRGPRSLETCRLADPSTERRGPVASSPDTDTQSTIRDASRVRGLTQLARDLGTSRATLAAYLCGSCRSGTALLLETRFRALTPSSEH